MCYIKINRAWKYSAVFIRTTIEMHAHLKMTNLREREEIDKYEQWWDRFELAEKIMTEQPDVIVIPCRDYMVVLAERFAATTHPGKIAKTLASYTSAMELLGRADNMEIFEQMYRERRAWVDLVLYKYDQYEYRGVSVQDPAELREVIIENLEMSSAHYTPAREYVRGLVGIARLLRLCDFINLTNKQRGLLGAAAATKSARGAVSALLPQPIAEEVVPHMVDCSSIFD